MRTLILLCVAIFIVGCGNKKPPVVQPPRVEVVTVKEPVPVPIQLPAELLAPLKLILPTFISPSDPKATSALDAQGERDFRAVIETLLRWREAVLASGRALLPGAVTTLAAPNK